MLMRATVLDQIPVKLDYIEVLRRLKRSQTDPEVESIKTLVNEAKEIARPKALYEEAYIQSRTDDELVVDGITFHSRVLSVNLQNAHRFIAYVVTCGKELEEWSKGIPDLLLNYYAEAIKEIALRQAVQYLNEHLERTFRLGKTSHMSPGSLEDWPISQQKPLFQLLGNTEESIGLKLTDSFLMIPVKSLSGIRFSTEADFENCMLCPRTDCPGRRVTYDPKLYESRYK